MRWLGAITTNRGGDHLDESPTISGVVADDFLIIVRGFSIGEERRAGINFDKFIFIHF